LFALPPALPAAGTIALVAPSYAPRDRWLQRGAAALRARGYTVLVDPDLGRPRRFHRAEDRRRAEHFTEVWCRDDVDAVLCGTGGYGATRVIPYLDASVFAARPKPFAGYSDITALHLWLMRQAGLRTFHGPTVDDLPGPAGDPSLGSLLAALTTPRPRDALGGHGTRVVRAGRAAGPLTGGNLSLVQQSIGTAYEVMTDAAILFVEETRDPMSSVDERLVHLRNAGLLDRVAGVVVGHLSIDRSEEDEFEDFLLDLFAGRDIPIVMDFPAGHAFPNLTLPLGTRVDLAADESSGGWLRYAEPALKERI